MAPVSPRSLASPAVLPAAAADSIGDWPYLEQDVLLRARSRRVCMTCHWFRHHAGPGCIPLLTCQLHRGLIAHGEHLISRCPRWSDDRLHQQGWAPEVA